MTRLGGRERGSPFQTGEGQDGGAGKVLGGADESSHLV